MSNFLIWGEGSFKSIVLFYIMGYSLKIVRKMSAFHLIFKMEDFILFSNAISFYRAIGLMSRVFANGPGDRASISGQVIPKIKKKKNSTWYRLA